MLQAVGTFAQATSDTDPSLSSTKLDGTNTFDATFYTSPIFVGDAFLYTIAWYNPTTGAPSATVTFEGCNDESQGPTSQDPDGHLAVWFTLAFVNDSGSYITSKTVSNATTFVIHERQCGYRWVRMKVTMSSGTVLPTARLQKKGVI